MNNDITTPEEITEATPVTLDELESIDMNMFNADIAEPEGNQPWRIADDSAADWTVQKIAEERAELARIEALAAEQIARINEKVEAARRRCENGTAFLTSKLAQFFETVPHKETKTKHSYRLLSGTLAKKLGGPTMEKDDAKLLEHLRSSGNSQYIQQTEKPMWGEYKKRLEIQGDLVIDKETGEIVEGVTVKEKPDTFTVEI